MSDRTVAFPDLTGCSMPYDFFGRIIKACDLGERSHNRDAVSGFLRTATAVDTRCITCEQAIDPALPGYIPMLHTILDDVNHFRMKFRNTPFTVIVLS